VEGERDEFGVARSRDKASVSSRDSRLGAVGLGLAAGAAGAVGMTAWQELSAMLLLSDSEGGEEMPVSEPRDPWEHASAQAQVARGVLEGVFDWKPSPDLIPRRRM
jgi:hypothetical protein